MIQSANDYPLSQIFDSASKRVYEIPKYQREYTWQKPQWEVLFDDLMENDEGYYLGSFICVNHTGDAYKPDRLEVIDGQQRLVTLSLLLAAFFFVLKRHEEDLDDDLRSQITNIKRKLVLKGSDESVRLIPQIQNHNSEDFFAVLAVAGVILDRVTPKYAANRRIFRAYRYFLKRIETEIGEEKNPTDTIERMLEKVNHACMVKIEVSSHADAYTLFESLNNRGIPLNPIDLIKNKLLATFDRKYPEQVNLYFKRWVDLLKLLGEDYSTQERFFRHYYNAFKRDLVKTCAVPIATRSNLIGIYEKLIESDSTTHLEGIFEAGRVYSYIISRAPDESFSELECSLKNLERIQGAPSYLLLLYLMSNFGELSLSQRLLTSVIDELVRFFVRRNLTDVPPTRDLSRIFMSIVEDIESLTSLALVSRVERKLNEVSASNEEFKRRLLGPVYQENSGVTRFILCSLAEKEKTRESNFDLWKREKNQFVWTVEHILPQGEQLPETWVNMIADGNIELAREIQHEYTHKLGNLTLSGYNSALSNKSFMEKRDRTDSEGHAVGYKNGLNLNRTLAVATEWNECLIEARTQQIVCEVMALYAVKDDLN